MAKPYGQLSYREKPQFVPGMTRTTYRRKLRRYHRAKGRTYTRLVCIWTGEPIQSDTTREVSAWHFARAREI